MGVEAARSALRGVPVTPEAVYFATADPAYLDKTNATAIHAALDPPATAAAYDMLGSVRPAAGALRAASGAGGRALAVPSDVRPGLSGGADERDGGDAAAALLFGEGPIVAEPLGHASQTAEFLERWRVPGEPASRQWEERFGEHVYVPLGEAALAEALKQAAVTAPAVDVLIVAGTHARSNRRVAASAGVKKDAIADDLSASIGNAGAAHAGLMLAAALHVARPHPGIALLSLAHGADARAARRRAGDHRDVHRRPARILDVAPRRRRRHRLRGRRPVPVRDDRRGPEGREDRRPRRADVPAALHGRRDPQLLLESTTDQR